MSSPRRTLSAAAAIAALALLAACGSSGEDSKNASQILTDAQTALKSATSYHLVADLTSNGNTVKVDMKVDDKNTAQGHMETQGIAFDFINAGGKLYIRGKELFAKFSQQAADTIGDQWVTATGNSDLESATSGVEQLSDPSQLADQLSTKNSVSKGGTKTVNGVNCVALIASDGELDVSDGTPAYPVHLEGKGSTTNKIDLTEYGNHFGITAPSKALDFSSVIGG